MIDFYCFCPSWKLLIDRGKSLSNECKKVAKFCWDHLPCHAMPRPSVENFRNFFRPNNFNVPDVEGRDRPKGFVKSINKLKFIAKNLTERWFFSANLAQRFYIIPSPLVQIPSAISTWLFSIYIVEIFVIALWKEWK